MVGYSSYNAFNIPSPIIRCILFKSFSINSPPNLFTTYREFISFRNLSLNSLIIMSLIKDYLNKYNIKETEDDISEVLKMKFGKKPDYEKVFNSYKTYILAHSIKHFGKDPKYISASDSIISLYSFINRMMYLKDYTIPKTPLTEYLFGDDDFYEIIAKFDTIEAKLKKERKESLKNVRNR